MTDMSLAVSMGPHQRNDEDTRSIMLGMVIALAPALLFAIFYSWGWRAMIVVTTSVGSCVFFEWAYRRLLNKPLSINDFSAVVTGMLIAFLLPVSVPLWLPVVGAFVAIVIVKQLYGGLGKNFMNPALAANAFLLISWAPLMSIFYATQQTGLPLLARNSGAAISQTPLEILRYGVDQAEGLVVMADALPIDVYTARQLLFGQHSGNIGEVSVILLLAGALYLLMRRIITLRIPVIFIGTVAVLTFLFPMDNDRIPFMLSHLLSGSLVLGAIFMATDYTTSPTSRLGQYIFAFGCGALTVILRYYGAFIEGVTFAILIMNTFSWLLDKYLMPRRFGTRRFAKWRLPL